MKRTLWLLLLCPLMMRCSNDETINGKDDCLTTRSSSSGLPVSGRYIISLPSPDDEGNNGGRKGSRAVRLLQRHNLDDDRILNAFNGEFAHYVMNLSPDEARRLASDPEISFVEQDKVVAICACFAVIEPKTLTWNVDKVGYGDGTGKTAWLLDTGIDLKHPDLNVDTLLSRSFVTGVPSAQDDNGHGTHVAGIVGAKNNRIGTLGVASNARLIGMKVLDEDGNGFVSYVLDALAFVRKNAKAGEVVNISLGVEELSNVLDREISALAKKGIYVTIAAGNEGEPARDYSPGRTNGTNIYTISAVDSLNRFASFSNYGNDVIDYAAPGVRILSSYLNGRYAIMSGTSMAAPHVAGILLINDGKVNWLETALNDPDGVPDKIAIK